MSMESKTGWWLRTDAAISGLLALPGLIDPAGVAMFFGAVEPTYSFLVRLWSGLLLLFGWISWEAARNPAGRAALLRYIWMEKAIVVGTVLAGHLAGEAPPSLMGLIMLTNVPWILSLLYVDLSQRRLRPASEPGQAT